MQPLFTQVNNNGKLQLQGTTPPGRLVQGDCSIPSTTDMEGRPLVFKSGPKIGQPRVEYFTGVAFMKGVAEVEQMRAEWAAFERQCFPHLFNAQTGQCNLPQGISNKWIDGDGYDTKGVAWNTREGFAGHWVLRASSGFAPPLYAAGDQRNQLPPGSIPVGSFVREALMVESNLNATKPGLYVNLQLIEFCGIGQAIIRGPNAGNAFGQATGALPPGATVVTPGALPPPTALAAPPPAPPAPPAAPAPVVAAHNPLAAAQADGWAVHPTSPTHYYKGQEVLDGAALAARYPAPVAATPPPAPPAPPAAPVAPGGPPPPYHGYAQPPGAPVAPPVPPSAPPAPILAPAAPVVPAGPIMTAKAAGVPYETFKAQGWSDAQLIQEGHMIPGNVQ